MKCLYCGSEISNNLTICNVCGSPVSNPQVQKPISSAATMPKDANQYFQNTNSPSYNQPVNNFAPPAYNAQQGFNGQPEQNFQQNNNFGSQQMSGDGRPLVRLAPNLNRKDFFKLPQLKKATNALLIYCVVLVASAMAVFGGFSEIAAQQDEYPGGIYWIIMAVCIAGAIVQYRLKDIKVSVAVMICFAVNAVMSFMVDIWVAGVLSIVMAVLSFRSVRKLNDYWKSYQSIGMIPDLTIKKPK